jgi:hypothetical protein
MAYNTLETIDNGLRGEPYGQMTPEGQTLWDQYTNLLNSQQNAPMRPLKLRSGATMDIIDPSFGLKNRMLSKTLGGLNATGMGTRAKAQPGLFAQLAPMFIAAGIKDPKEIKKLMDMFSGGSGTTSGLDTADLSTGGFGGEDWGDLSGVGDTTDMSGINWDDILG